MFKVILDSSVIAKQYQAYAEQVLQTTIDRLVSVARDAMREEIGDKLPIQAAKEYVDALVVERKKLSTTFYIDDARIERFEAGVPSFSIKEAMLKSKNVKRSKNNEPYIDIPFQHRTHKRKADSSDRGTVVPAGSMRQMVQAAVERQKQAAEGSKERLFQDKGGERGRKFGDMQVKSLGGGQTEVRTFRRISENSTAKWQHPGWPGVGAFEKAARAVANVQNRTLYEVAEEMGLV